MAVPGWGESAGEGLGRRDRERVRAVRHALAGEGDGTSGIGRRIRAAAEDREGVHPNPSPQEGSAARQLISPETEEQLRGALRLGPDEPFPGSQINECIAVGALEYGERSSRGRSGARVHPDPRARPPIKTNQNHFT